MQMHFYYTTVPQKEVGDVLHDDRYREYMLVTKAIHYETYQTLEVKYLPKLWILRYFVLLKFRLANRK